LPEQENKNYELPWQFESRITYEHLGRSKYKSVYQALGELICNSFDADASQVHITVEENDLKAVQSLSISDNGKGISPEKLKGRFVHVGIGNDENSSLKFGKFGVGRFAVHRIGGMSKWKTISKSGSNSPVCCAFDMEESSSPLKISEIPIQDSRVTTGTTIQIFNIYLEGASNLTPLKITNHLTSQFLGFLLGNNSKRIIVQGIPLQVDSMIEDSEEEPCIDPDFIHSETKLRHLLLSRSVDTTRFPSQVLFTSHGRSVFHIDIQDPPSSKYLLLVESPLLDEMVSSNREFIVELDEGFVKLQEYALKRMKAYREKYLGKTMQRFIQRAREQPFYPFSIAPEDVLSKTKQQVYDVVLEKVHENVNIESMTKKQQAVIYRLLRRVIENENLLEILREIAELSDTDVDKFRRVLEKSTLVSIIKLSSEVSNRLSFLNILHELIYGDVSKCLKERTQLHKILEPHSWLFGANYHLATSDKSFREIIIRHREIAKLPSIEIEDIAKINGIADIPDLFFSSIKEFPKGNPNLHLLVELKAPTISIGKKETDQIERYANTILDSHEFDKTKTRWQLFIVSHKVSSEIDRMRKQKDKPIGLLREWDEMTVWAFEWSEIISRAKEELQLVRNHLKLKSEELSVSQYLQENFPEILEDLNKKLELQPV
jgi:hypothetical protein